LLYDYLLYNPRWQIQPLYKLAEIFYSNEYKAKCIDFIKDTSYEDLVTLKTFTRCYNCLGPIKYWPDSFCQLGELYMHFEPTRPTLIKNYLIAEQNLTYAYYVNVITNSLELCAKSVSSELITWKISRNKEGQYESDGANTHLNSLPEVARKNLGVSAGKAKPFDHSMQQRATELITTEVGTYCTQPSCNQILFVGKQVYLAQQISNQIIVTHAIQNHYADKVKEKKSLEELAKDRYICITHKTH